MNNIFVSGTFVDLNEIRSFIAGDIRCDLNKNVYEECGEIYRFADLRMGMETKA